jgi:hypothetical protein
VCAITAARREKSVLMRSFSQALERDEEDCHQRETDEQGYCHGEATASPGRPGFAHEAHHDGGEDHDADCVSDPPSQPAEAGIPRRNEPRDDERTHGARGADQRADEPA